MTEKIKMIYESGKKNNQFIKDIFDADGDTVPNFFSPDLNKNIFATIYYGWLVGKYGKEWKKNL